MYFLFEIHTCTLVCILIRMFSSEKDKSLPKRDHVKNGCRRPVGTWMDSQSISKEVSEELRGGAGDARELDVECGA